MTLILSGMDGLSDVDGSAATPAIRGTDTNTGIFFPAADTIAFSEGGVESMRIDSSGNVGIGTSSPTARVHVSAPDGTAPLTLNTAGGSDSTRALNFNVAGDNYGKILVPSGSGGAMAFWTGGANAAAERMRVSSDGSLLVGTTSTTLGQTGIVMQPAIGGQVAYITLGHANGTGSGNGYLGFGYNGSLIGSITQNGTTAVAYNTSSDYRLKENIAPMTGALATVAQLNPVTYNWIADGSAGQGFIAHELQAVVPDCVTGEKDAVETYTDEEGNEQTRPVYQGIDTSFLVATLTAAIKEQQAIITALTARVAALEAK